MQLFKISIYQDLYIGVSKETYVVCQKRPMFLNAIIQDLCISRSLYRCVKRDLCFWKDTCIYEKSLSFEKTCVFGRCPYSNIGARHECTWFFKGRALFIYTGVFSETWGSFDTMCVPQRRILVDLIQILGVRYEYTRLFWRSLLDIEVSFHI